MTADRVLFVMTASDHLTWKDGTTHPTGYWAEEFVAPYRKLKAEGIDIEIATPGGVEPPVDAASLDSSGSTQSELDAIPELKRPVDLGTIDAKRLAGYDAIFIPGGHGPVEDLARSQDMQRILAQAHRDGMLVAAVCHGPAALLASVTASDAWPYAGYQVTGFSNQEEAAVGLADKVPFSLQSRMEESGGRYSQAPNPWMPYVVRDRELITGENPASSGLIAEEMALALQGGSEPAVHALEVSERVATPPDELWARIGSFGSLADWHPAVASSHVVPGEDPLTRRVEMRDGRVLVERLEQQGARSIRCTIQEGLPLRVEGQLSVQPNLDGSSTVRWTARVPAQGSDPAVNQAVEKSVAEFYAAGLAALKQPLPAPKAP